MTTEYLDGYKVNITEKEGAKKIVLALDSCDDYKYYLANSDGKIRGSECFAPKDATTLSQIGKMSDQELITIINRMANVPHKSDIRVMYANGYGFSWSKLQVIAEFKGFINTKPSSNNPFYTKGKIEANNPLTDDNNIIPPATIYIERGRRSKSIIRKFTFSEETNALIDELIGSLANSEKSKVMEAILTPILINLKHLKNNGKFHVKFRATAEETIL